MTAGGGTEASAVPRSGALGRFSGSRAALWAGFALVHALLVWLNLSGLGWPLGDVEAVYLRWATAADDGWLRMGIDAPWVYPILAFAPMAAALVFGADWYPETWLGLVTILNAIAFAVLLGTHRLSRTRRAAAWWWLLFLACLGPIALGRIDAVTVPLALVGLLVAAGRPRVAAVLLTIATWVKVWPAVLLAAVAVAHRRRAEVVLIAAAISVGIVAVSFLAGSGLNVFGFLVEQAGRGLQVEAPIGVGWLWAIVAGSKDVTIGYDRDILTYQIAGPGVEVAAALATPAMAVAALGIVAVGVRAVRRGAALGQVLAPLSLALVAALMLLNKVGSPQFAAWLAAPVVLGLATRPVRFGLPAILAIAVAALTHLIYPYWYAWLLIADPLFVGFLTLKAVALVVLVGWGVHALWQAGRKRAATAPPALAGTPAPEEES